MSTSRIYYGDIDGYYPLTLPLNFLNVNENQKMIFKGKTPVFMEYIYKKEDAALIKTIVKERRAEGIYVFSSPELIFLNKIRKYIEQKNSCRFLIEL